MPKHASLIPGLGVLERAAAFGRAVIRYFCSIGQVVKRMADWQIAGYHGLTVFKTRPVSIALQQVNGTFFQQILRTGFGNPDIVGMPIIVDIDQCLQ